MGKRKDMLDRVAALTGASEDEIIKIYSALLTVIFDDMGGGGHEDALFCEISAALERQKTKSLKIRDKET